MCLLDSIEKQRYSTWLIDWLFDWFCLSSKVHETSRVVEVSFLCIGQAKSWFVIFFCERKSKWVVLCKKLFWNIIQWSCLFSHLIAKHNTLLLQCYTIHPNWTEKDKKNLQVFNFIKKEFQYIIASKINGTPKGVRLLEKLQVTAALCNEIWPQ